MKKVMFILLLITLAANAQTKMNKNINVGAKAGITFPGITIWYFTNDDRRLPSKERATTVYPNYLVGLNIESNKITDIDNAIITLSLDLSYGKTSTGKVKASYGESEFQISSLPILLWTKFKSEGRINPYVRLGIGTERTQIKETHFQRKFDDFDIKEWFFCWGIGAGIEFDYFDRIMISLFVDTAIKERSIYRMMEDGREINFDGRNGVVFSGIQLSYKL